MTTHAELIGKHRAAIESAIVTANVSIPAKITAVNGNRVSVVPAIHKTRMNPDGSKRFEETAVIDDVPVVNLSCGVFSISIPLKVGCNGLLIFCDYDIDNWLAGNPNPHTSRYHDQTDCFFIPAFNGGSNDVDCLELRAGNTVMKICENGFDVIVNGQSFISALSGCCAGIGQFAP